MAKSRLLFIFFLMLALTACWRPFRSFEKSHASATPDYARPENWAALPDRIDNADRVPPMPKLADLQSQSAADVFFIHPTTYLIGTDWNGDVTNAALNSRTDELSILNQASAFNGAGRIYAPRYRQAHIYSYFDKAQEGDKALDLAWEDVKRAFEYYLEHYNRGRPIIIAAHSQGTDHAVRLVKTFFDENEALRKQLVAAYLIGRPIDKNPFTIIVPCEDATQTGCFITWNTVEWGTTKFFNQAAEQLLCTNPLSWTCDTLSVAGSENAGSVTKGLTRVDPGMIDAKIADNGLLWVHQPVIADYPDGPNYHTMDYSFFYMSIRNNAMLRVKMYLSRLGE